MMGTFSRALLGASALMIAAGCASAPPQRPGTANAANLDDDVQSRSTGVQITKTNGVLKVTLLSGGNTSFGATKYTPPNASPMSPAVPVDVPLSSSEPLYILNGMPYTPGPGGLLIGIEPHDIVSIKAVKDPAELSLYGMRGGNGVIAIVTKQLDAKKDPTKP